MRSMQLLVQEREAEREAREAERRARRRSRTRSRSRDRRRSRSRCGPCSAIASTSCMLGHAYCGQGVRQLLFLSKALQPTEPRTAKDPESKGPSGCEVLLAVLCVSRGGHGEGSLTARGLCAREQAALALGAHAAQAPLALGVAGRAADVAAACAQPGAGPVTSGVPARPGALGAGQRGALGDVLMWQIQATRNGILTSSCKLSELLSTGGVSGKAARAAATVVTFTTEVVKSE